MARFLRNLEARTNSAIEIVDRYTRQMATAQGLTSFLKSPILQVISTMSTGNTALAYVLAEQIPLEQAPIVIGKLQMAYDLYMLLNDDASLSGFDLRSLWSLLLDNNQQGRKKARAFGNALVEYWTKDLSLAQLQEKYQSYLN
ncbi:MAG: GTPase, partial [Pleurocapsa sp.]